MEFLNNLGINSTSGYFGVALLVVGGFMFLAGIGVITIQQVTVKQGRATWVIGLLFAAVGIFLVYPELARSGEVPDGTAGVADATEGVEDDAQPPAAVENNPVPTLPSSVSSGVLSDWKVIEFTVPGDGLWHAEGGRYTAIGSKDTFAWSQEIFAGDVEISMDIESPVSFAAANIIVYGNGGSLTPGNLIFSVANDLQAISADSIYEGEGGRYLFSTVRGLDFGEQKHSVLISIIDQRARLFLDGDEIGSVFLARGINTSGKIGLLKYWETGEITFSNIHVRSLAVVE